MQWSVVQHLDQYKVKGNWRSKGCNNRCLSKVIMKLSKTIWLLKHMTCNKGGETSTSILLTFIFWFKTRRPRLCACTTALKMIISSDCIFWLNWIFNYFLPVWETCESGAISISEQCVEALCCSVWGIPDTHIQFFVFSKILNPQMLNRNSLLHLWKEQLSCIFDSVGIDRDMKLTILSFPKIFFAPNKTKL